MMWILGIIYAMYCFIGAVHAGTTDLVWEIDSLYKNYYRKTNLGWILMVELLRPRKKKEKKKEQSMEWDDNFETVLTDPTNNYKIVKAKTTLGINTAGFCLKNCLANQDSTQMMYEPRYLYFLLDDQNRFQVSIFLNPVDFVPMSLLITRRPTEIKGVKNSPVASQYFDTLFLLADHLRYDRETLKNLTYTKAQGGGPLHLVD